MENSTPIHERSLAVNPQSESPLFNSRIPPEIRDAVFNHAVSEYSEDQFRVDTHYTRPGYTGYLIISTSLLSTCRRIYLETYHLPVTNKEHVFWRERGPLEMDDEAEEYIPNYFDQFFDWQKKLITEIHIFAQMWWLDTLAVVCEDDYWEGIEKLTITIRRGDWWWWEMNFGLAINPKREHCAHSSLMADDWAAESNGAVIPFEANSWGTAFEKIPSLKKFVLELETGYDKKDELDAIVQKAKSWRFPMKDGAALSTEGVKEVMTTWTGPPCFWSDSYPFCENNDCAQREPETQIENSNDSGSSTLETEEPLLKECAERLHKIRQTSEGPKCYIASLTYKRVNPVTDCA